MSAPSWIKSSPQDGQPSRRSDGIGWGNRPDRRPRRGTATDDAGSAQAWHAGMPMPSPIGTDADRHDDASARGIGTPDRHDDTHRHERADADAGADADADLVPVRHDIAVPAEGEGGALVMRGRAVVSAQEAADGLRFANMRNKSLREVLRFARDGEDNLSHFLAYYAFKVAFFYWVTVPVLTVAEFVKWVHARPHRFLFCWGLFFLGAGVLNRFADGLVPDGLDASTWSAITWAWVAGGAFALLLATVVTYVRNR